MNLDAIDHCSPMIHSTRSNADERMRYSVFMAIDDIMSSFYFYNFIGRTY